MADLSVRGLSDEVYAALKQKASADGKPLETWLKEHLASLAQEPIIRSQYAYRVYGKKGQGVIRRHSDHPNGTGGTFKNFSEEEADALKRAEDLMRRNGPGDLVKALSLLQESFSEVFEVPV